MPGDPKDNSTGLGVSGVIPTELDQATGIERKELLEILKGNKVRTSALFNTRHSNL